MSKTNDIFLDLLPSIDLHGYDRESAKVALNDFILENKILKNKEILIIHGIGKGIVKQTVQQTLSENKNIIEYKIVGSNIGCTTAKIKI